MNILLTSQNSYFISEMILKSDIISITIDRHKDYNRDFIREIYITDDQLKRFDEYVYQKLLNTKVTKRKLQKEPIYNLNGVSKLDRPVIKRILKSKLNISRIYQEPILSENNAYYIKDMEFKYDEVIVYITRKIKSDPPEKLIKNIYIKENQYRQYEKYRSTIWFFQFDFNVKFDEVVIEKHKEEIKEIVWEKLEASNYFETDLNKLELNPNNINEIYIDALLLVNKRLKNMIITNKKYINIMTTQIDQTAKQIVKRKLKPILNLKIKA